MGSGTAARNVGIWGYTQAQDAIGKGQALLDLGKADSLDALGQARTDLNTNYLGGIDRLNPWVNAGTKALGSYTDSLGLNGQQGYDNTVAAYRASPGYQYQVDQASDALARKQSALGALGSGNTMQAISDRAQNMADAEYGKWQGQLQGLSNSSQQAATSQAALQGQLGSALGNLGQYEAGLHQSYAGQGLGNLWQGTNAGLSAVQGAQKQAADNVASQNSLWANAIGSGLNLLSLGTGGGNTLGGSLFKLAGG